MTSNFIYINPQGVPCAPTRDIPLSWQDDKDIYVKILMDKIKSKAIPIWEDDRQWVFLQCNTKQALQYKPDSFIEINPYEFEVKTIGVEVPNGHYVTLFKTRAHIIRPSEPKADPKEKELYSIKNLEWVNEMGLSEVSRPFDFGDYASGPYYTIWKEAFGPTWYWIFSKTRVAEPVSSKEEAKQKCSDHFNSKLKLCLNREL